jgi:hypothetical protein
MMIAGSEELCVSDLLQQNERKWNEDLIYQVFNERDATEIF